MYNVGMPTKGKTEKRPVKNSVNVTLGTMPFFQGRVRLKIAQSKFPLRLPTYNTFFPRKSRNENHPVKSSVNNTKRVQRIFRWEEEGENHPVEMIINSTPGTMHFSKKE